MLMGTWADAPSHHAPRETNPLISKLDLPGEDIEWLEKANASDETAWNTEFGSPRDPGLDVEANIFRYRPAEVVLRLDDSATPRETARIIGSPPRRGYSASSSTPGVSEQVREVLSAAGVSAETVDDSVFISNVLRGEYDENSSVRVATWAKLATLSVNA
ncbi:hypothetical protein [Corynebacterium glutamicum]|uniref:hypothetical protein n=1 Tax=Corynebacterium glutamicum TaxID=1718 RepID=UPI0014695ABA|nr:hypothetical protein [Corynebacterium glutamicum]GFK20509.1 hypothetical protein KbCgl_30810 [Corynebacterium glutamicum]